MNKKFSTIILFSLICAAAFAAESGGQTVLTVKSGLPDMDFGVYGVFDIGADYSGRNVDQNTGKRRALDSGLQRTSRLGLTAGAKIYDDLKTGVILERRLYSDTGAEGKGFNRQALLYFESGKYGKISLGRQLSSTYALGQIFEPFISNSIADMRISYKFLSRTDNTLAYASPNFDGLSFTTGYTFSAIGDEKNANNGDISMAFFAPYYKNGNFQTAFNFQYYALRSDNVFTADIFASYDFGVLKLTGAYGRRFASEDDFVTYESEGKNTRQLVTGLIMTLWKNGRLSAVYARRRTGVYGGGSPAAVVNQYSLGLTQALNESLNIYLIYTNIINNGSARGSMLSGGRLGSAVRPNSGAGINSGYQNAVALGVNFAFNLMLQTSSK